MSDDFDNQQNDKIPHPPFESSTCPDKFQVTVRGVPNEYGPEAIARRIGELVVALGRWLDLERLDGVTIAGDYEAALQELDRGVKTSAPQASNEFAIGVAMSVNVLREDVVKSHIVLNATYILPLNSHEEEITEDMIYLLAHECAHIHDLKIWDESYPRTSITPKTRSAEDAYLIHMAECCWSEYAASRLSGKFGVAQGENYAEILIETLPKAKKATREKLLSYGTDRDLDGLFRTAVYNCGTVAKFASYLLGHSHGSNFDLSNVENLKSALEENEYLNFFEELSDILDFIWSEYGRWESEDPLEPLARFMKRLLSDAGLELSTEDDGSLRVDVPFFRMLNRSIWGHP